MGVTKYKIKTEKLSDYDAKSYGWAFQEKEILLKPYFKLIGNLRGKRVLDFGCGTGWITKLLSKNTKKTVGTDISKGMINIAKEKFSSNNIDYQVLDSSNSSKLSCKFDIIVSSLMLHASKNHKDMIKTLNGCHKILKNNGEMVILVPHPCFSNLNKRGYNTYNFKKNFNYFDKNQFYNVVLKSEEGKTEFTNKFYNLSDYFLAFQKSGFVVSNIVEPELSKESKKKFAKFWDLELKYPFYIIFKLKKSTTGK